MSKVSQERVKESQSGRIFKGLSQVEESRHAIVRAANEEAVWVARKLTQEIMDSGEVEERDQFNLPFEILTLMDLMPSILVHKKRAAQQEADTGDRPAAIGPISYQSGSIDNYLGALMIAVDALEEPIEARWREDSVIIHPGADRERVAGDYRALVRAFPQV